jgi:hypothetical protein
LKFWGTQKDYWANTKISNLQQTVIHAKPLYVITDNVIIWLLWSIWPRLIKSWNPSNIAMRMRKRSACCNHSNNVISFSLSQSDHIYLYWFVFIWAF